MTFIGDIQIALAHGLTQECGLGGWATRVMEND
jgi:hypothetical protein